MSDVNWGDRLESPLGDNDLMSFGKHKGKRMKDVPGKYLCWLLEQDWFEEKWPNIHAYIVNNIETIEEEKETDYEPDYVGGFKRHIEELDTPW